MHEKNELMAYAMDFSSYLVLKLPEINKIILHGSIVRDDFDEDSDVDLFIDTDNKNQKKIKSILEEYKKTQSCKEWELKGIKNEISIISGDLDSNDWKDLKRAMTNNGIILYGKYKAEAEKIAQYVLFSFENIKPDKKRISIYRKIFGFKIGKKEYPGMMSKLKAVKISKGSILVPIEHTNEVKKYFQDKKVTIKLYDLWSDYKI